MSPRKLILHIKSIRLAIFAVACLLLPTSLIGCGGGEPPSDLDGATDGQAMADGQLPAGSPLLTYKEAEPIDLTGYEPTAIAVDPSGNIVIAGDSKIARFSPDGEPIDFMSTTLSDACITVAGKNHDHPGYIYVAGKDKNGHWRVESFTPESLPATAWDLNDDTERNIRAIAAGDADSIYLSDSAQRVLWHYDIEGNQLGKFDGSGMSSMATPTDDNSNASPGFIITDIRHFDIAMGPDGLVRIVNPRRLRIEAYTSRGDRELIWGRGGSDIETFYGCCNPAHIDILPDGRVFTLEKGRPRIKIYSIDGKLQAVVAQQRDLLKTPIDLAAAPDGSVWVLEVDPQPRLRHFVSKSTVKTNDEEIGDDNAPTE